MVGEFNIMKKLPTTAIDTITVERAAFNAKDNNIMGSIITETIKWLCIKYEQDYDNIKNLDY